MSRISDLAARRPWRIIAVAAAFLVVAVLAGAPLTSGLTAGGFEDPDTEFVQARERLEEATGVHPAPGLIALVEPGGDVRGAEGRAAIEDVAATLRSDPDVARVVTALQPGTEGLVSGDGSSTYLVAYFRPIGDDAVTDAAARIQDRLAGDERVLLGGSAVVADQVSSTISSDLTRAELIAFPVIFLLSLLIFRGVVAALLPTLMGGLVILGAFLAVGLFNQAMDLSIFALNLIIGLGLGLAIDYSLLIVSRYREEIARRGPGREALRRTLATAGRSVLYSAVTVAAALAGLMVFPQRFLFSMGVGGVAVAVIAAAVALLVLPAALALLGGRINAGAPRAWRRRNEEADRPVAAGFWYRLSRAVMRRPGLVAAATAVALVLVALPALGINFTSVDARVLPSDASARQVSDALASDFAQDRSEPVYLAVRAPDDPGTGSELGAYADRLAAIPGVAGVDPPRPVGPGTWRIDVYPAVTGLADEAQDVVRAVRAEPAPHPTLAGGLVASFVDQRASISAHLPWAVLIIAASTLVALFLMTGSVVLPVKAVIMNLLTLGATLGLLVVIFQDGNLEGLLGFTSSGALDMTQPILLGAIAFGLSTDYAVFLLSRIKEAHEAGLATTEAVAVGLQRTGRIVTAAALLFAVAIGAFATSEITLVKELGVGTALAVLIDASIIRALLVPSLMGLLGRWNWWAPRPLRRLHARVGLGEPEPVEA